jgi:hypothetical protein
MTVDYQLQRSDLVAISEDGRRFLPKSPSRIYYFYVLPLLFAALAIVVGSLAIAAVFSILYLTSGWLVRHWVQQRYRSAVFCDDNLSIQTLPQRVALSADGATFSSDAGVLLYRWRFIRQVVRDSRYVVFVLTPLDRMHIPLRAFRDDEQVRQFVSMAESYGRAQAPQPDASPNCGPSTQPGGSAVTEGSPSVR